MFPGQAKRGQGKALLPTDADRKRQEAFIEAYCETGSAEEAAKRAGYTKELIAQGISPCRLLKTPGIAVAIRREIERRLAITAPKALNTMISLLDDKEHNLRYKSSRDILDRTNECVFYATDTNTLDSKILTDMTVSELKKKAEQLEREIANRADSAKVIDASRVDTAPDDQQAIDVIG